MIGNVMSVEDECLSRGLLAAHILFLCSAAKIDDLWKDVRP